MAVLQAQPEPETGMSCGTDDRPGQGAAENAFDGEVDEAANRREFLEALAAWRKGGASDTKQTSHGGTGTDSPSSSAAVPVKAASVAEEAETGTGTDVVVPKPNKPTGPYFDKLMREAQARAAGEAAALKVGCKPAASAGIQKPPEEAASAHPSDAAAAEPMDED